MSYPDYLDRAALKTTRDAAGHSLASAGAAALLVGLGRSLGPLVALHSHFGVSEVVGCGGIAAAGALGAAHFGGLAGAGFALAALRRVRDNALCRAAGGAVTNWILLAVGVAVLGLSLNLLTAVLARAALGVLAGCLLRRDENSRKRVGGASARLVFAALLAAGSGGGAAVGALFYGGPPAGPRFPALLPCLVAQLLCMAAGMLAVQLSAARPVLPAVASDVDGGADALVPAKACRQRARPQAAAAALLPAGTAPTVERPGPPPSRYRSRSTTTRPRPTAGGASPSSGGAKTAWTASSSSDRRTSTRSRSSFRTSSTTATRTATPSSTSSWARSTSPSSPPPASSWRRRCGT